MTYKLAVIEYMPVQNDVRSFRHTPVWSNFFMHVLSIADNASDLTVILDEELAEYNAVSGDNIKFIEFATAEDANLFVLRWS